MEWFNSRWGFFTNGSKLVFFVKPHSETQELIFSEFQDWDQDDVHLAMAGLTFAMQDASEIKKSLCDILEERYIDLANYICPESERDTNFRTDPITTQTSVKTKKRSTTAPSDSNTVPYQRSTRSKRVTFSAEQDEDQLEEEESNASGDEREASGDGDENEGAYDNAEEGGEADEEPYQSDSEEDT